MRIVFMGTPDFAVPPLRGLLSSHHQIAAVYCQPARPGGRGMGLRPSPVQEVAEAAGVTVATPKSLRSPEAAAAFAAHHADVALVVAYGLLLPATILALPRHGCLNLHPSKLPRWRGAAPIQRTIMAGDTETAICVIRMDEGLDTGPVCLEEPVALPDGMTAGQLHDLAARRGAELMLAVLSALEAGTLQCRPQPDTGVTYAAKIDKAETRIDWTLPAAAVEHRVHGLSPFPGAWCKLDHAGGKPERIKVLRVQREEASGPPGTLLDDRLLVACGTGALRLLELQRAGRKPMPADELLRGLALPPGLRLD